MTHPNKNYNYIKIIPNRRIILGKQKQTCKQEQKFLLLCIQCYPETGAIQCIHCANKGNNSFHVKKEILLERLCSKTRRRQPTEKKMTTRRITYSNTIEYHHRF
jgi:hypothetical protein